MFFFSFFMAMGMLFVGIGTIAYFDAQEVKDWPTTTGTVTNTWVREEYSSGSRNSPSHYDYYPEVEYTYKVNGATYYGNQLVKIETGYSSFVDAQSYNDRYATGTQVTVYYNPDNPNEAVLEQNSDVQALMFPGIGALFALIGAVGFIYFFKKWRA